MSQGEIIEVLGKRAFYVGFTSQYLTVLSHSPTVFCWEDFLYEVSLERGVWVTLLRPREDASPVLVIMRVK
jgi:hypothetical protein